MQSDWGRCLVKKWSKKVLYRAPEPRWERAGAPLSQAVATSTVVADDAAVEDGGGDAAVVIEAARAARGGNINRVGWFHG